MVNNLKSEGSLKKSFKSTAGPVLWSPSRRGAINCGVRGGGGGGMGGNLPAWLMTGTSLSLLSPMLLVLRPPFLLSGADGGPCFSDVAGGVDDHVTLPMSSFTLAPPSAAGAKFLLAPALLSNVGGGAASSGAGGCTAPGRDDLVSFPEAVVVVVVVVVVLVSSCIDARR